MAEFLSVVLSLPTVVFTGFLGVSVLYWMFVLAGVADVDLLDGAVDGAIEGAVDGAVDGAIDGAVEAVDGAIDGAVEAIDGAAEAIDGAAEGLDGAAEAAESTELVHAAHQGGWALSMVSALRLRSAPVTVTASVFSLYGWLLSALGTEALFTTLATADLPLALELGLGLVVLPVALLATSVTIRPLGPVFKVESGQARSDLVGQACQVTTGHVDERFGQARVRSGGTDLVIQVRNDRDNGIERGQQVIIVNFDPRRGAFIVEPMHQAPALPPAL